ncbi:MAG TPA: chemotaxis protein CheA [Pyrinomonadaceae bacterium]|jgi:two-component system chemotaxis sensor kinase CheA
MDEQLLQEFLAEAEDLIEVLFGDIKTLRARHAEGRARRELVGRIFRHIHTIKGSAAAAGLDATSEIAHEFESLLDAVRMGRVAVDASALDAFEDAVQVLAEGLNAVARREPQAVAIPQTLIQRLRGLASAATSQQQPPHASPSALSTDETLRRALAALPAEIKDILSEYELQRLREAVGEGARLFIVAVDFGLDTFDEQFRNLSDALAEGGEVISTLPGMQAGAFDRVNFRILYAAVEPRSEVAARVAPFGATLVVEPTREAADAGATARDADEEARAGHNETGEGIDPATETRADESPETAATLTSAASSLSMHVVRVPLDVLDEIISSTHELFTDTIAMLDQATVASDGDANVEKAATETRAARIRRRFFELEESLINLRMVTLERTLERAVRAGRSVARAAGKDVDFDIAGGEVRIDKSLADAIADPLLHLLRNAVDHGVEPPAERERAGKVVKGRVRLEATAEGNRVRIRVADDGRGLDPEQIARVAIAQGLVAPDAHVNEQLSLRLIFRPGFTTAGELSSVSGRGVGLEVVEHAVEQFGGELRVSSRKGHGTTFEMHLPTTLALVPAWLVRAAGQRYCVDARHVVDAGVVALSEMERANGTASVHWRGESVPLVQMRRLLEHEDASSSVAEHDEAVDDESDIAVRREQIPYIISRIARRKTDEREDGKMEHAAVAVDELEGEREVLVRTLGRHATRWRGVSGATELRDGTVALMLDLPRLLEMRR